jgi:hypothetical protein
MKGMDRQISALSPHRKDIRQKLFNILILKQEEALNIWHDFFQQFITSSGRWLSDRDYRVLFYPTVFIDIFNCLNRVHCGIKSCLLSTYNSYPQTYQHPFQHACGMQSQVPVSRQISEWTGRHPAKES